MGNTAENVGGGIYTGGTLELTNSTLSGNSANQGGGIENGGTLELTNSTLSGNSANQGGGILTLENTTLELTNSTLSGNSAGEGGGIASAGSATATLAGSIVAYSPSGGNCFGPILSQGDNLSSDDTCVATDIFLNDRPMTDPQLDPAGLQDNGGPTQTIALQPTSPALDGVLHNPCPPPATDQRGVNRPVSARCDIGAVEMSAGPSACTLTLAASVNDGTLALAFTLGTQEPATWNVWLTAQNEIVRLLSIPLSVIDPPVPVPFTIPFVPPLGTVGVLTTLTTPDQGILCSEFATVETGPVSEEAAASVHELQDVLQPLVQ
jgi:predicted outer membrane repeat protein